MKQISWNSQGIDMPELDFDAVEKWIADVASRQGRGVGQIGYLFCTDEKILEVNRQFLDHDYYTDIITFDYSDSHIISGDIVISLDTVRSNADQFVQPYRRELMRVIIHGILHLCGIDDKGPGEREIMERYEDESLEMIGL
ncbi:rRNA maturation RNase YbeY [Paramuribaculum intestinale]|uniref:rRNA maturation RNase YbeY n=1 Tax=Paramuribaculum intestinale TaxID=2094151 RepID=UPI000F495B4A|nr:rRNA maturation RNase YbeY [Paramuribaculum intestinale]ROT17175.1 rRNA maturation RNase YbeY [Muribaculaceae bacterium Isolate-105 (HZI)]RXE61896.1 rRNA maturation RNase YbeY [Muribaculaceae bacterium Isolate-004 (NCI)]